MKKEITIKAVQKGATYTLWSTMYVALAFTGALIIIAYTFVINPVKHHWAIIPIAIIAITLLFSKLIARIAVKSNKKLQVRYVVETIDGYNHSAQFFRNLGKQYEEKLKWSAENMFEQNEQNLDTKLSELEVYEKSIRAKFNSFLQRAGNTAKEALKEATDDDIREMIRDHYKEYVKSQQDSLSKILLHLNEQQGAISEEFQQEVESILCAREKLVAQYYSDMEKIALEYAARAQEWQSFLENNYD